MGILCDWQIRRDVKIEPWADAQKRPGVISYGVTSMGYDVRIGYKFFVLKPYPAGAVLDPKEFDTKAMFHEVNLTPRRCVVMGTAKNGYACVKCGKEYSWSAADDPDVCVKDDQPKYIDMPPYSFMLGESVEKFTIPRDVLVVNVGKSTYARCGLIVNVTPGEPEWNGYWTLELTNPTPRVLRVYAGEGIMQSMFFRGDGRYELGLAATHALFQTHVGPPDLEHTEARDAYELLRRLAIRDTPTVRHDENGMEILHPVELPLEGTCRQSYADKKGKYQDQAGLTAPTVDRVQFNIPPLSPVPPTLTAVVLNTPPAAADKKYPWKSTDGSTWHYSYSSEKWVRVPPATEARQ